MKTKTKLREGFSTGTAATAAAMAALECLLSGVSCTSMLTPMPPQEDNNDAHSQTEHPWIWATRKNLEELSPTRSIAIAHIQCESTKKAFARVIKDGGDDPDATHNAAIEAHITLTSHCGQIRIDGGKGVGRVTLPGLPVAVGKAAINPAPQRQIVLGLHLIAHKYGYGGGMEVCICVPHGEAIAKKTFNSRLGILGGISILGTQGTVKPFSHTAWQATISQGIQVASATDCTTLCLSTGRRSEKLLLAKLPHLPAQAAVQAADFVKFSLEEAGKYPFENIAWGCFFGKLIKLAQGYENTHARQAKLDFTTLYMWCAAEGMDIPQIQQCVTAQHALEYILAFPQQNIRQCVLRNIHNKATTTASAFAARPVHVYAFHLNGQDLLSPC